MHLSHEPIPNVANTNDFPDFLTECQQKLRSMAHYYRSRSGSDVLFSIGSLGCTLQTSNFVPPFYLNRAQITETVQIDRKAHRYSTPSQRSASISRWLALLVASSRTTFVNINALTYSMKRKYENTPCWQCVEFRVGQGREAVRIRRRDGAVKLHLLLKSPAHGLGN